MLCLNVPWVHGCQAVAFKHTQSIQWFLEGYCRTSSIQERQNSDSLSNQNQGVVDWVVDGEDDGAFDVKC